MKYNARQLNDGRWAVFKDRCQFWPKTATNSHTEASATAAEFSASWHLEQALKLLPQMSLESCNQIGHRANELIDVIIERQRAEDPNFDERDPRGWLS